MLRSPVLQLLALIWVASRGAAAGTYFEVSYEPSEGASELKLGVTYTLWVPKGSKPLRGLIVHQHGCGAGACRGGATAAYDLHWQALAEKWHCGLLGPSYQQADAQDCTWWSDPRKGSGAAFLNALEALAAKSGRAELAEVPWCLWGHSGGGFWAGEMLMLHPERVVAVWQRSGAARFFRENDPAEVPEAVYGVPMMCNPGMKEKTDRFAKIWEGMMEVTRTFRAKGAPVGLAPDPRTSHECGDSRYLAIPFFDACLGLRLPATNGEKLRRVDMRQAWLAPILGTNAVKASAYAGTREEAIWLPNAAVARAWSEYVRTGAVSDTTAPQAASDLRAVLEPGGNIKLNWEAKADFESGLGGFVISRNGQEIGRLPQNPVGRFGRPLFQVMSYHDTPEKPLPEMTYTDRNAPPGEKHRYEIRVINSVGLQSKPVSVTVKATPRTGSQHSTLVIHGEERL